LRGGRSGYIDGADTTLRPSFRVFAMMSQPTASPPFPSAGQSAKPSQFVWTLAAHLTIFVIITIQFLFVVPRFTKTLKDLDAQLPAMTLLLLDMSSWWMDYWYLFSAFGLPIYIGGLYFVAHRSRTAARISTYCAIAFLILLMVFSFVALYLPVMAGTRKLS
jgi:hypothetical protein